MAIYVRHRTKPELGVGRRVEAKNDGRAWVVAFPKRRELELRRFASVDLMEVPEAEVTKHDRDRLARSETVPAPTNVRDALIERGKTTLYHVTPLHHLPAIVVERRLVSKATLRSAGRTDSHFRSSTWQVDEGRGFGHCVHLMLTPRFDLLDAKLKKGIPHVRLELPTVQIPPDAYITPWNVGRNRQGKEEPQSLEDGHYIDDFEIRVGHTVDHVRRMLAAHPGVEVLARGDVSLSPKVEITAFDAGERDEILRLLDALKIDVPLHLESAGYRPNGDQRWLAYLQRCIAEGRALAPPALDFD